MNDSDNTCSGANYTPRLKNYINPYETQSFFYENPTCTYSKFPIDSIKFNTPSQNVFYFRQEKKNNGNYFAFQSAYPSFPYMPCMYPN